MYPNTCGHNCGSAIRPGHDIGVDVIRTWNIDSAS